MKNNDIFEFDITGMTHDAMGVGKVEGRAVFVQGAIKGDDISNAEFFCGTVEEVVPSLYAKSIMADVAVVDPPRKGCDATLLETMVRMHPNPNRIVYVSCNPSTLAGDLRYLDGNGYD